jgi:hypothetical protein
VEKPVPASENALDWPVSGLLGLDGRVVGPATLTSSVAVSRCAALGAGDESATQVARLGRPAQPVHRLPSRQALRGFDDVDDGHLEDP